MPHWMKQLAHHYERTRSLHPTRKLLILFDIDGTIFDMRHTMLHVLKRFDEHEGTEFFSGLTISDITVHENQVEKLLSELSLTPQVIERVLCWYAAQRWTSEVLTESHHPYPGVMEVIRWFQIQRNTSVGINTGRPEALRAETLRCLNRLGREYKVSFSDALLHMNPHGWNTHVPQSKAEGVQAFHDAGYRVFAFVDNEPENLHAVSALACAEHCLLLHADTIFESTRARLPQSCVSGSSYDLTELIPERSLPRQVRFVWAGLNDEANLRQFLASRVECGECDVRTDPTGQEPVCRHDSFTARPLEPGEHVLSLEEVLAQVVPAGKSLVLHLHEDERLIDALVYCLMQHRPSDTMLGFRGSPEVLKKRGFRRLAAMFPSSVRLCPVQFLAPSLLHAPEDAYAILTTLSCWGINRFSFAWGTMELKKVLDRMDEFGFEVDISNVPGLEAFLRAVLLQPKSITSDFNFSQWHLFGRGAGRGKHYHEYGLLTPASGLTHTWPHSLLLPREGSGDP